MVWKAISLMSRMMAEVPSAEARILSIATCICSMAATPSTAASFAPRARASAWVAFSALPFAMAATASRLALVSSSHPACSEAPLATASADEAIWLAAEETWPTDCDTCASASSSAPAVAFTAVCTRVWSPR